MVSLSIQSAKKNRSDLIDRVQLGEEIVITKGGKPVAKLSALDPSPKPRTLGLLKGKLKLSADFDAPLPEEIALGSYCGSKAIDRGSETFERSK